MDKLRDDLLEKIEKREKRELKQLTPRRLRRSIRKYGEGSTIIDKCNIYSSLADLFFLTAEFKRSYHYDILWKTSWLDKIEFTGKEKGKDSLDYNTDKSILKGMGWRTGEMKEFSDVFINDRQPFEINSESDEYEELLEFYEVFFEWALMGEKIHERFWLNRIKEASDWLYKDIAAEFGSGKRAFVMEAFLIYTRLAYIYYWIGDFEKSLEYVEKGLQGISAWGSNKPSGMVFDERLLWKYRLQGINELLLGKSDPKHLKKAIKHLCRAMAEAEEEVCYNAADLPILMVTALSWSQPDHRIVSEFKQYYPHLTHLLEKERKLK